MAHHLVYTWLFASQLGLDFTRRCTETDQTPPRNLENPEIDPLQGVFQPLAPNTSELFVPLLCCSLCQKCSSSLFCSPRPLFPPGRVCTSRPGAQPSVPVLPKGLPGARPRARPSALAVPHTSRKPCKFDIILPLLQMRKLKQR